MSHLRFLSSDELKGRKSGTEEAKISARYIAEQFRSNDVKSFDCYNGYLQPVIVSNTKNGSNESEQNHLIIHCNNVVGYIEGTDSNFKDEFILLVAHYDHLGVISNKDNPASDSIYNGARDNAIGVTALIYAAKKLSASACKRGIIFLATTAEEQGMLGSKFFVDNPPVPLKKIVFVLNNDGGGFNDTTCIRIGGKNRISFHENSLLIFKKTGLMALSYPSEISHLYYLGDNISFAQKGIPAITVSPGFDEIDGNITKFIHNPIDEVDDTFNERYLLKFCQVYIEMSLKFANCKDVPFWKEDQEFYKLGIDLYSQEN